MQFGCLSMTGGQVRLEVDGRSSIDKGSPYEGLIKKKKKKKLRGPTQSSYHIT